MIASNCSRLRASTMRAGSMPAEPGSRRVVGAVEQGFDCGRHFAGFAVSLAVLVQSRPQRVGGARQLDRDAPFRLRVALHQPLRRFAEKARLLLDQQHVAARPDDREVDLADDGEALRADAGPVHAVEDRVTLVETVGEERQRLQFARRGAAGAHLAPAIGEDSDHRLLVSPIVRRFYTFSGRQQAGLPMPTMAAERSAAESGLASAQENLMLY